MGGVWGGGGGGDAGWVSSEWESLPAEQLIGLLQVQAAANAVQVEQLAAQSERISALTEQVAALTAQVAELTRKLGRNSKNSSLPPSADRGLSTKGDAAPRAAAPRRRRGSTTRKPGGQPGHPGRTRDLVADPDEVLDHVPGACAGCGGDLRQAPDAGDPLRRQVHDIPDPVPPWVVEHRLHSRRCGCGHTTTAPAPAGVCAPVQLGPNVAAVAVYLVVFQHVAVERAAGLIHDLCGITVSTGWISAQVRKTSAALTQASEAMVARLRVEPVVGVDETSVSVGGVRYWLHVARTDALTVYYLHPTRGREAVDAFGVLPDYTGVIVRDALAVYDGPMYATATHALCGAHLLRDLTAAAEDHPDQVWPGQAGDALLTLNRLVRTARDTGRAADPEEVAEQVRWFDQAIAVGLKNHPRAAGRKQTPTRNLLHRMKTRREEYLRYVTDPDVPFTNNGAERDLRPAKTQQKISGSHRSATGATAWAVVRGHISTLHKQRLPVLTGLRDALTGNPWTPAPS
ncbi:MAG: transposase [Micrococcales bacterium]|nr:MAG: transposase [Micrococcales bacterium]